VVEALAIQNDDEECKTTSGMAEDRSEREGRDALALP
jgi:hypothetical protein